MAWSRGNIYQIAKKREKTLNNEENKKLELKDISDR